MISREIVRSETRIVLNTDRQTERKTKRIADRSGCGDVTYEKMVLALKE